ncbi:MAG TPA: hypothetical protein DF613_05715 [Lachnospiraceae bacterium]|nr:hypothetical protein [Lachnospiraceae bacterium]
MDYQLDKSCVYVQDPGPYSEGILDCENIKVEQNTYFAEVSGDEKYLAVYDAYFRLLRDTNPNLSLVKTNESIHDTISIYSAGFDYTGTSKVTTKRAIQYGKEEQANVTLYCSRQEGRIKIYVNIPLEMRFADLGYRYNGSRISTAYVGGSVKAGLYKCSDGTFQTTDGRLSTSLNAAQVIRDGKTYTASAAYEREGTNDILRVKGFYRNEMFLFCTPADFLAQGDIFRMYELESQSEYLMHNGGDRGSQEDSLTAFRYSEPGVFGACHDGSYIVPVRGPLNRFEALTVRVMYYVPGKEAVYYIYAKYVAAPHEIEALCAIDISDTTTAEEKANTITLQTGQTARLEAPPSDSWQAFSKWEVRSGSDLVKLSSNSGTAVTVTALKAGTAQIQAETSYPYTYEDPLTHAERRNWTTDYKTYTLRITSAESGGSSAAPKKGTTLKKGSISYKVTKAKSAVEFAKAPGTAASVSVPDTVKINGITYKVTSIAANALKGNRKVTKVTIGKNVTSIGKNAFNGCKELSKVTLGTGVKKIAASAFQMCPKLKNITVKSTKLTSVGKNAFKGIHTAAKIKVPAKKLKAYKKLLKGKGQGKKVKIVK